MSRLDCPVGVTHPLSGSDRTRQSHIANSQRTPLRTDLYSSASCRAVASML